MCPIREKFGCPITITVFFRPQTALSVNAHLIGLAIRAKLNIILPQNQFKLDVLIEEDKHVNKLSIERQINDKERVAAAFEKEQLWHAIMQLFMPESQNGGDEQTSNQS